VISEREQTFFTGTLLDPDDFRLDQNYLHGKRTTIVLTIRADGREEEWIEVEDFIASAPEDRHFVLDHETGSVTFGDGEHGRRPEAGCEIVATYRRGVGAAVLFAVPLAAAVVGFAVALALLRRSS
jgi:hypothetical protein